MATVIHAEIPDQLAEQARRMVERGWATDSLPRRAAKLVKEWCLDHQGELLEDWRRAQALMPLKRISRSGQ